MSDEQARAARAARDYALGALARREHSREELARKLEQRGIEAPTISATLDTLRREGLQCDDRFASAYVSYRGRRGYGPRRVAQELKQRGVSEDAIRQALSECEHDWFEQACTVRLKKYRAAPLSFAERARQTRFLEYRGFDNEQIRHALGNPTDDENF